MYAHAQAQRGKKQRRGEEGEEDASEDPGDDMRARAAAAAPASRGSRRASVKVCAHVAFGWPIARQLQLLHF